MHKLASWSAAITIGAFLSIILHGESAAQLADADPRDFALDDGWQLAVAPYLWATALDGDAGVDGNEADVDIGFDDIWDDLAIGVMGYMDVRQRDYGFFVNPLFARLEPDDSGDLFDTDITTDMAVVSAGGFFRAATFSLGETASGFERFAVIEPMAGVRWTYLRVQLDIDGPLGFSRNVDKAEHWFDPFVGFRTFAELGRNWVTSFNADVGGFANSDVDHSWNLSAFLTYRTKVFGTTTNLGVGYRAFKQDYDNGDGFAWDVTMHGPVFGASFRF